MHALFRQPGIWNLLFYIYVEPLVFTHFLRL